MLLNFEKTESLKEKKEELGEEKAQKTSVGNTRGIIEAIHGAPAQSFVAELAETIAGLKNERKMAIFWQLVVEEVRNLGIEFFADYIPPKVSIYLAIF